MVRLSCLWINCANNYLTFDIFFLLRLWNWGVGFNLAGDQVGMIMCGGWFILLGVWVYTYLYSWVGMHAFTYAYSWIMIGFGGKILIFRFETKMPHAFTNLSSEGSVIIILLVLSFYKEIYHFLWILGYKKNIFFNHRFLFWKDCTTFIFSSRDFLDLFSIYLLLMRYEVRFWVTREINCVYFLFCICWWA